MKKIIDVIPKIAQYGDIFYAKDFECRCGKSSPWPSKGLARPALVGWCETHFGLTAVFECPVCGERFMFHPSCDDKFDLEELDGYLGIDYLDDSHISNTQEIKNLLKQ